MNGALAAMAIIRPPNIVSDRLRFYRDSSSSSIYLLSLFSSATLRARWTELNQNRPHDRKWVRFENACPKSGVSFPTNRGPQNNVFSTTSQRNGNFNGLYLRNETRYTQSGSALTTTWGLLHCVKMSRTLVHKRLQIGPGAAPRFWK